MRIHVYLHIYVQAYSYTFTYTHTLRHTHTQLYAYTYTYTYSYVHAIIHTYSPLTRSAIGSAFLARIRQDECDIEARRLLRAINESCTVTRSPPSSDVTFRLTPSTATPRFFFVCDCPQTRTHVNTIHIRTLYLSFARFLSSHTHVHAHIAHMYTHVHTHIYTHIRTHTHVRARRHTHTHITLQRF